MAQELQRNHLESAETEAQSRPTSKDSANSIEANLNHDGVAKCTMLGPSKDTQDDTSSHSRADDKPHRTEREDSISRAYQNEKYEKSSKYPWMMPHIAECQKHAWYTASLGMGSLRVADEWGFHSASASRSHSPYNGKSE
jgi:hypothetical protein